MVRDSLQKAVVANFLLARNRFRTNYIATFLWDSSGKNAQKVDDQLFLIPAHVVRVERRASGAKPKLAWAR